MYEGRMPEKNNEIAMDLPSLAVFGYSYEVGQTVTVTPINSCSDGPSTVYNVLVNQNPGMATFTTGSGLNPAAPCIGNAATYQVNPINGISQYSWSIPTGWTAGAGASTDPSNSSRYVTTGPSITVTPSSQNGSVAVRGVSLCSGGSDRSIALQPVSVQGQAGLNAAVGIAGLQLREPPRVVSDRRAVRK